MATVSLRARSSAREMERYMRIGACEVLECGKVERRKVNRDQLSDLVEGRGFGFGVGLVRLVESLGTQGGALFTNHFLKVVVVVAGFFEGASFLVFGDFAFEEVLLFFEVDGFGEPGEGIVGVATAEGF